MQNIRYQINHESKGCSNPVTVRVRNSSDQDRMNKTSRLRSRYFSHLSAQGEVTLHLFVRPPCMLHKQKMLLVRVSA